MKKAFIATIILATLFPVFHQLATVERGGVIAFGGEILIPLTPFLIWSIIDSIKGMRGEKNDKV